jgi:hypothetical protein
LKETSEVKINEKFSFEDFMTTLQYLYTGKSKLTEKNWEKVLLCSDFYGAKGLRSACFDFMLKSINHENVLEVLQKAQNKGYEFDATDLIKRCVVFIEDKAGKVMKSKAFLDLHENTVALILMNTNSSFDELEAFHSCVAWARHQKETKNLNQELPEILSQVLKHIRYTLIPAASLVRDVKPLNVAPVDLYAQAIEYHACPHLFAKFEGKDPQFTKRKNSFVGSNILDEKMSKNLLNLLPVSKNGWSLIYQGSKDSFATTKFHSQCDGHINTVTIIKSDSDCVFGGYSELAWSSASAYTHDTRSFLFSLKNKTNQVPVKFANNTNNKHSAYGAPSYGPTFGGGHDLYICNNANTVKSSYSNLGYSYKTPGMLYNSTSAKNFLAGSYNFLAKEIEVYEMSK